MLKPAKQQLSLLTEPLADAALSPIQRDVSAELSDDLPQRSALRSLWLCIRFPDLPLDAVGSPRQSPAAVFADNHGQLLLRACNVQALDAGIVPGMSLNSALALLPELDIRQQQPAAEQTMLQALAHWALAYTPVVSIDTGGALLLEVRGSLRLFGGLRALRTRIAEDLRGWGQCAVMASAPVPRAARWLARVNMQTDITALQALCETLRDLPIACLDWPANVQQLLLQMGVCSLGECVRLPRDGFARRIGPTYLRDLDQGFGRHPELLHYYHPPETFHAGIELDDPVLTVGEIAAVMEGLFAKFAEFLLCRQVAARQLDVRFLHAGHSPTAFTVAVREPCSSAGHFSELCRLQLERLLIPGPVTGVFLKASAETLHDVVSDDLLRPTVGDSSSGKWSDPSDEKVTRFVEQLRARLGAQRVYGLHMVADHRPEYAWSVAEPCNHIVNPVPGQLVNRPRPLWLLAQPLRLEAGFNNPAQQEWVVDPYDAERIESGWWDGRDIRRDYYRVINHLGVRLWVYRDCRSSDWYLHGLFG